MAFRKWFSQSLQISALSLALGMFLGGVGSYCHAWAAGRMVLGLKAPVTPAVIRQLARDTNSQIVQVAPDGAYVLVLPKQKQTAAQLKAKSDRITYVEPEVAMGVADQHELLLVIPMRRLPGKLVGAPSDMKKRK